MCYNNRQPEKIMIQLYKINKKNSGIFLTKKIFWNDIFLQNTVLDKLALHFGDWFSHLPLSADEIIFTVARHIVNCNYKLARL